MNKKVKHSHAYLTLKGVIYSFLMFVLKLSDKKTVINCSAMQSFIS